MARPSRIDAALFDFDGTLCDTERENIDLVRDILHDLGAPVTDDELTSLCGGDDRVTVPPLLERYGSPATIDEYEARRDGCYRTYAEADLALEPGARELIDGLRARGVAVGLVSTTTARCILTALDRMRLLGLFDVVVCGDMVSRRKPDPEPYQRAMGLLGVEAAHTVVVEDSTTGIAAARAAGCHVVAYSRLVMGQDQSAADEVIDSFAGFSL